MNDRFLIPANSKKSALILGLFNKFDVVLFGSGVALTMFLMAFVKVKGLITIGLIVAPAVITGLLVFPVPNYHNVLTLIRSVWRFFTERERFIWKGWCVKDEFKDEK